MWPTQITSCTQWEQRIQQLDARLEPLAKRPVDITRPGWLQHLQSTTPPLNEAGIREPTQFLLNVMIAGYAEGSSEARMAIRQLFLKFRSFAWAAALSSRPTTVADFREHLILFSMKDQGRDSRDALLTLQEICSEARAAGVDPGPLLHDVASMSSDIDRFGMGSTRQMLLRMADAAGNP